MDKVKVQHLFCQHCRAVQKVMNVVADCWYNPLDQDAPAFCASNEDFITAFSKLFPEPPDDKELREKIAEIHKGLVAWNMGMKVKDSLSWSEAEKQILSLIEARDKEI